MSNHWFTEFPERRAIGADAAAETEGLLEQVMAAAEQKREAEEAKRSSSTATVMAMGRTAGKSGTRGSAAAGQNTQQPGY